MRRFNITINGKTYLVEAEEIGGMQSPQATPMIPKTQTVPTTAAAPNGGGNAVTAPMPGKILDIKVNAGEAVKTGQVLLILEAMKMENEIMANRDGTIDAIKTEVGTTVNSGDVLLTLR